MLPDALLQGLEGGPAAGQPEAGVAAGADGVVAKVAGLAKGDVDLLARVGNVEPGDGAALQDGHGRGDKAERVAVKGVGQVERAGRHDNVDVGDADNHG